MIIILSYLLLCFCIGNSHLNKTKLGALIIFISGVFIMGYRSVDYTGDNVAYAGYYIRNSAYSIAESWNNVVFNASNTKDPFYYFVGNVFSKLGFDYRGWFIFIAAVFMGGYCYVMYKHSEDFFLSTLVLVCLSYFQFAMTGLRQAIAMGILLFSVELIYKKKLVPFVILVLLAAQFHSSALIFIIAYPLRLLKPTIKLFIPVAAAGIVALLFPNTISIIIEKLAWNDSIAGYADATEGLTISGFIIQFAILWFCYYFYSNNRIKSDFDYRSKKIYIFEDLALTMLFVGVVLQAFAINIANIFRMSMYFSILGTIMIPSTIYGIYDTKMRTSYYRLVVCVLLLYFVTGPISHYSNFTLFGGL